ncbi:hypothetical protein PAXRUDRAFT_821389 [Paxillus rubicundulus Ve08.2h10]|uniref:Unplaced genomic scaffold scaffold_6, whole genome shotgun sequence n=1 Tax=Paxillus rubicundulus Ve08.2h10 TaxID=930991 RepID=A0A0D0E6M0_9AGAM|nr:hypothetical protein PAXRUDRAFT_821389 [Paxillus rubicundulus Ve08.2h10]
MAARRTHISHLLMRISHTARSRGVAAMISSHFITLPPYDVDTCDHLSTRRHSAASTRQRLAN